MRIDPIEPPREYTAGFENPVTIRDCARVHLEPDEQVTFVTGAGAEYDLTRKRWGFYATPSTNSRLADHNLRAVVATNRLGRAFVLLVERGHEDDFLAYLAGEPMEIVAWLDTDEAVAALRGLSAP